MSKKGDIIFMQARLLRLAAEKWMQPLSKVVEIFKQMNILGYIEAGYEIFHCEGDEAILEDIDEMLARKGKNVYGKVG